MKLSEQIDTGVKITSVDVGTNGSKMCNTGRDLLCLALFLDS